jgi:hypothetical protein
MRLAIALLVGLITQAAFGQSSFAVHGFLTAREIHVKGQPSWLEGGFGRFDAGAESTGDHRTVNVDAAQLGMDWTPRSWLLLHADGVARSEPSRSLGRSGGLLQAFVDLHNEHWRLRAGTFWLPTSRENVDPLWSSRYTITYSALNSWIGEEFRPIGADLQYSPNFYVTLGGTAFRGNDTMGTELAAHGWTFGNRLTVYNEDLPLPPPDFGTTKPFGRDLDGRNGYAERIRIQLPERAMLQFTHVDNRAELLPSVDNQTPWLTRFDVIGGDVGSSGPTTFAAEWASGSTAVGFPGGSFQMDFDTAYALVSNKRGADRLTARYDHFRTWDHARAPDDSSREHGYGVTLAWFHDLNVLRSPDGSRVLRTGLEYARIRGDHPGAAAAGFDPNTGGSTLSVELRYGF